MIGSTFTGNSANFHGGGVYNLGLNGNATLNVSGSTFSASSAGNNGGGVFNFHGTAVVSSSTLTANRSDSDGAGGGTGGGIWTNNASVTLHNTIVAGNLVGSGTTAGDIHGALNAASSFNLIGDAATAGGLTNGTNSNQTGIAVSTVLDPVLAFNGGPTQTHALLPGSPAIDAGSNALATTPGDDGIPGTGDNNEMPLTSDQRGAPFVRVFGSSVDIGAFELANFDFGDAPMPYPTKIADDGARHIATGPRLGAERDLEADGASSSAADGDDDAGANDDEDGVLFGVIQAGGTIAGVNIWLDNAASAKVDAWIDFNRDGDWNDPGEKILDSRVVSAPLQTLNYNLPPGVTPGENYARVRLSTLGNLGPTGLATDGEVEDYRVSIISPPEVDSVVINDGTPGRSQITSLTVTFNTEVDLDLLQTAFTVTNKETNVEVGSINVDALNSGGVTTAVLTFAGAQTIPRAGVGAAGNSLADGNYRLTIDATKIRVGLYVEMAADYIFGGANPGDSNNDAFFRLYGDSDGDRDVDGQDYGRFGLTFLKQSTDAGFNAELDFDGDGDVDGQDYGRFGQRFLRRLPE